MRKLVKQKTKLRQSGRGNSISTTVPLPITQLLEVDVGDKVIWDAELTDDMELVIKVSKVKDDLHEDTTENKN